MSCQIPPKETPQEDEDEGFSALAPEDKRRVEELTSPSSEWPMDWIIDMAPMFESVKCVVSEKEVRLHKDLSDAIDIGPEIEAAMIKMQYFFCLKTFGRS